MEYGVIFWSFIKVKFLEFISLSFDHLSFRLLWCYATKVLLYHGLTICSIELALAPRFLRCTIVPAPFVRKLF